MSLTAARRRFRGDAVGIGCLVGSHVTVSQMQMARVSHTQIL
jgi:hypothetical protein